MLDGLYQNRCTQKSLRNGLKCAHEVVPGRYMACCPVHDDKTPSLSISDGGKGILLHCHAGCSTDSVLSSLGLKPSDLFHENSKTNGNGMCLELPSELQYLVPQSPSGGMPKSVVMDNVVYTYAARYDYRDANKDTVLVVIRYENGGKKTFRQYTPVEGGFQPVGLKRQKVPVYRLPDLLEAQSNKHIYVS